MTTDRPALLALIRLLALSASILLAPAASAGERCLSERFHGDLDTPVSLAEPGCGDSECVMVFGSVGESFQFALDQRADLSGVDCRQGLSATGDECVLPRGVEFDADAMTLKGVPQRAGFHEFVVQVTEKGVTEERVILIDIDDKRSLRSLDTYAAYFFGGIR